MMEVMEIIQETPFNSPLIVHIILILKSHGEGLFTMNSQEFGLTLTKMANLMPQNWFLTKGPLIKP